MLVLMRKEGEQVQVGDVVVKIISIHRGRVKLGFDGPRTTAVCRTEIRDRPAATGKRVKR